MIGLLISSSGRCVRQVTLPMLAVFAVAAAQDTLLFVRPASGEVIGTNSLPIEAKPVTDRPVDSVAFFVTYLDAGYSETDTVFRHWRLRYLVADSVPPYRTIWDIAQVQDHYHRRIVIDARAHLADGDTLKGRVDDFVVDRNPALKSQYLATASRLRRNSRLPPARSAHNTGSFLAADNRVRFRAGWSTDSLHFAITVVDAAFFTVPPDDDRFWGGDQVEIFLDLSGERAVLESDSLRQFVIAADGRAYGGRLPIWHQDKRIPITATATRLDSGYQLDVSVAWVDIGSPTPRAGDTLGLDLSNFDRDARDGLVSMSTWSGNHLGNHHNASEWGILILAERPLGSRPAVLLVLAAAAAAAAGALFARRRRKARAAAETTEEQAPEQPFDRNAVGSLTAAALEVVAREYGEESCNLEYVAAKLNRTPKHISAVFRKETGMRFTDYLNDVRLRDADRLLRTTHKTAFDVSIEVGYHSYEYFSRIYKRRFGMSPSEVRRSKPSVPGSS